MKHQRAFTLVELSIVLVILGLLVGGVLTGQSLIRAAELRSVATQFATFQTATNSFKDKYFALAGDMTNATSYWGEAASGSACFATAGTGTQTCNGNGNGLISDNYANSNEIFRFWQQLANAGLIEGSYDGIAHGTYSYSTTKANAPSGKIGSSLWFIYSWGTYNNDIHIFNGTYDNFIELGQTGGDGDPGGPIFKAEEAYNIDMKIDDGKPATGKVRPRCALGTLAGCTTAANAADSGADYLLSSSAVTIALMFYQTL